MINLAALHAAVFSLSAENLGGRITAPRPCAGLACAMDVMKVCALLHSVLLTWQVGNGCQLRLMLLAREK